MHQIAMNCNGHRIDLNTYEDVEYSVTLCGKDILPDPEIPWAGPLYLLGIPRK